MPLDEDELVERARQGDVTAYEGIVRRYQELAFRTACLITGPAEAEDATQDAFVKAYYALPRFRSGAPLRPWLLRIVANEAINRRRAAGRRSGLATQLALTAAADRSAPSPEETLLEIERRQALLRALNELRADDRLVIAYRYFHGLAEPEIATVMGCARGTVKSRLSRAIVRLRQKWVAHDPEGASAVPAVAGEESRG